MLKEFKGKFRYIRRSIVMCTFKLHFETAEQCKKGIFHKIAIISIVQFNFFINSEWYNNGLVWFGWQIQATSWQSHFLMIIFSLRHVWIGSNPFFNSFMLSIKCHSRFVPKNCFNIYYIEAIFHVHDSGPNFYTLKYLLLWMEVTRKFLQIRIHKVF